MLGPVIGYGNDYELFQFVYDLHLGTMLGSKRNLKRGEIPLRILMKGASFTPGYWKVRHLALIDMQRQLGLPQLFFTLSPYEWSFPYHKWVVDEMEKALRPRLHLPAAETLHLAHVLHQLVEGWITGMNSVSTRDAFKNWKVQLLRGDNNEKVVINFCARLEFQDGKHKKPKYNYNSK